MKFQSHPHSLKSRKGQIPLPGDSARKCNVKSLPHVTLVQMEKQVKSCI